jgi:hypothetical protein
VSPGIKTRAFLAEDGLLSYAQEPGVGDGNGWTVTGKGVGAAGVDIVLLMERCWVGKEKLMGKGS